ncbi:hypothetical protein DTO021D3_3965 [Paecilomyces variotii]|nr:hypothetical protein DTO032I3_2882 [Paecilomyces variotii]KAJ9279206.1 hypothetical protein DTO021D3_3965 [Paecilomyces variotii]KAJ9341454.1 hypothetical protein DTO027B6_5985 [Paecilomyces variotii]KAJ9385246.1 hypothetical protein DTO032I4_4206 [Paecilomyces variotii]KAJ9404766.1 hypothetical protein DTO045G8_7449 [Paecilomyces variotii]
MRKKSNPEEYKQYRREKGRMAQRAFRQRQIDTINKLEEEVSLLRDSIQKICQAATNELSSVNEKSLFLSSLPLQDSQQTAESELLKAIRYAGQIAGVDESVSMGNGHESCSNQNLSSEQVSDSVDNQVPASDISIGTEGWLLTDTSSSSTNIPPQPEDLDYLADPIRNDVATTIPPQESHYPSSLDTGLTTYNFDPLLPSSNSLPVPKYLKPKTLPFHMLPYMDRDADTFAGRIFWKSLSLAFQYGTASLVPPPLQSNQHTERRTPNAEDEKTAHASKMLSHSSAIIGKEAALRRIGARLEFLRTGTLDTDSPLWDADSSIQLRVLIEEDAQRRGEKMSDWLRIPDIVDYISSRCGMSSFAQLDALGTVSVDGGGIDEIGRVAGQGGGLVTRLIEDIAWNASCFGDGPRYRAREVKEVIDSWVNTLTW